MTSEAQKMLYGVCDFGGEPKIECEEIVRETANSYFVERGLHAYRFRRRIEKVSACLDEASAWRAFRSLHTGRFRTAQSNIERAEKNIALAEAALEELEAPQ